jgi:hypothetical protein
MLTTKNSSFSPNNRGGYALCIGNGQLHDALCPEYEVAKTLNCMDDPMKIMVVYPKENDEQNIQKMQPPNVEWGGTEMGRNRSE